MRTEKKVNYNGTLTKYVPNYRREKLNLVRFSFGPITDRRLAVWGTTVLKKHTRPYWQLREALHQLQWSTAEVPFSAPAIQLAPGQFTLSFRSALMLRISYRFFSWMSLFLMIRKIWNHFASLGLGQWSVGLVFFSHRSSGDTILLNNP